MSRQRERRLRRVLDVMQKELDKRVAALAESRAAEAQAYQAVDEANQKRTVAIESGHARFLHGSPALDWEQEHAWRTTLQRKVELSNCARGKPGSGGEIRERMMRLAPT
jgi:hypothetical protein